MKTFATFAAAILLAACGDGGSKYAAVPKGDPTTARSGDLRGVKYGADVLLADDGRIFWAQQAIDGYSRLERDAALTVADLPPSNCRFPAPATGALVRHVIVERGVQDAPIFFFNRREVGERAANFVKYYAATQGRNDKVWNHGESDVMRVANVVVTEKSAPVYLVLSSETNVLWNILAAPGATISNIALISNGAAGLANAPDGAAINVLADERLDACRTPQPMRRPQDNWGFIRNSKESGAGYMKEAVANNNRYAADYSRWFRETFGVPSESDAIAQMGLSNALIGPMPAREADRVPYRAIGAGPVLLTPKDYRIVAPLADYAKAHDAIITEAARKAAGGDLGAIARATKS
ncbi:MAG: hypothetical protein KDE05_09670 [Parvularculaceae bacterium]|nr:hypothetical protein [Parvularculaceae bacterium]